MGIRIAYFENGYLGLTFGSVDTIINPAGKQINNAFNLISTQVIKEAGDKFNFYHSDDKEEDLTLPITSPSFELKKKKGIKNIISTRIILSDDPKTNEIEAQLNTFYVNSLSALPKRATSIAIPIIIINNSNFSVENSLRLAFKAIDDFSSKHPSINIYAILNDRLAFDLLINIKNSLNLKTENTVDESNIHEILNFSDKLDAHNNEEKNEQPSTPKHLSIASTSPTLFSKKGNSIYSFLNQITPNTPKELKGKLIPLLPLTKISMPKAEEAWESFSNGQINKIIAEKDGQLDHLKFLLGPVIYPIRCRYEQGGLNKLNWDLYKSNFKLSYLQKALEGINTYYQHLKNLKIFSLEKEDIKNSKLALLYSNFSKEKDRFQNNFQNGLDAYIKYISTKLNEELSIQMMEEWSQIKQKEDAKIKDSAELISLVETWINLWNDQKIDEWLIKHSINDTQKSSLINMHSKLLTANKEKLTKLIDENQYLDDLIIKISSESKKIRLEISKIQNKIKAQEKEFTKEKNEEINAYRKFSKKWLSIDANYITVERMISADESGYPGRTIDDLITLIIRFNAKANLNTRTPSAINAYRESLAKRERLKEQFTLELKKQIPDPSLENLAIIAKSLHQYIRDMKSCVEVIPDESRRNLANSLVSNTRTALTALIDTPLEWNELSAALNFIACKSEAQQHLKNKLAVYINNRDPDILSNKLSNACFDKKKLVARRRQVSYLISCLYIASAHYLDENILFNSTTNTTENIGVNLILEHLQHSNTTSSNLKDVLNTYLKKLKEDNLCYLSNDENEYPLLNLSLSSNEIISKSTSSFTLPNTLYEYDPRAAKKPKDEIEEEKSTALTMRSK